jgi:hypothetical protein
MENSIAVAPSSFPAKRLKYFWISPISGVIRKIAQYKLSRRRYQNLSDEVREGGSTGHHQSKSIHQKLDNPGKPSNSVRVSINIIEKIRPDFKPGLSVVSVVSAGL